MGAAPTVPGRMTLAEFLQWDAPPGVPWQGLPVREIVIVHTEAVRVQLPRRGDDGSRRDTPMLIEAGDLALDSVGMSAPVAQI